MYITFFLTCLHFSYANIISVCVSQIKWFEITVIVIIQSNNHYKLYILINEQQVIDPYILKIVSLRYSTQLNCVVFGDSFSVRVQIRKKYLKCGLDLPLLTTIFLLENSCIINMIDRFTCSINFKLQLYKKKFIYIIQTLLKMH